MGQPFEMDMGYSNPQPPDSIIWLKDGMMYRGDGDRVKVNHEGITFSNVLPKDHGRYRVMVHNRAGTGRAYTVLKGFTVIRQNVYTCIYTIVHECSMYRCFRVC